MFSSQWQREKKDIGNRKSGNITGQGNGWQAAITDMISRSEMTWGGGQHTRRETDGVMAVYSPLPESNATGCLQIMQMKCKSEEQCSKGNGFHIDVVMEMPHTTHMCACARVET